MVAILILLGAPGVAMQAQSRRDGRALTTIWSDWRSGGRAPSSNLPGVV